MNLSQSVNPTSGLNNVHCDVTNCYYNKQKSCDATEIQVGPHHAATSADTVCSTFRPR